jgi:Protein of unknown function (DUF3047)
MENRAPIRVFADDMTVTSKYWETVTRKNYSQPEKELMLAVLKDALMTYKKRVPHSGNALFKEAETWFFDRDRDRLFSFETICVVLGLSPGKIRQNLLSWKLSTLSDIHCAVQKSAHGHSSNTERLTLSSEWIAMAGGADIIGSAIHLDSIVQRRVLTSLNDLWAFLSALGYLSLKDFEGYPVQSFPGKWRRRSEAARKIYRVKSENGNHFLHAYADMQAVQIGLEHLFDPAKFRRLRWRWRVHALPQGADERRAERHDAAAQVYVVFDNQYLPRVIKYIWSAALPKGTSFTNPLYGRGRVVVLRSGSSRKGEWHQETINFYDDYKELFGQAPGQVQGIGILSSSDSTGSVVIADYDDFTLLL